MTVDGGRNGWQSGFIPRKFYSTEQIDGEFGNKAWLRLGGPRQPSRVPQPILPCGF